jgi:hypothetical protein
MGTSLRAAGASTGRRRSCSRISGDALSRNQCWPLLLIATEDCVRGQASSGFVRAIRQQGHQQFHWGKPPPAAAPSRRICTRRGVGGAHREPRPAGDYRRAAYAVTSSVTATSLNSGFVQVMQPPESVSYERQGHVTAGYGEEANKNTAGTGSLAKSDDIGNYFMT